MRRRRRPGRIELTWLTYINTPCTAVSAALPRPASRPAFAVKSAPVSAPR